MTRPSISQFRRFPVTAIVLESTGSLVIALVIWLDELLDVPHSLFGAPASPFRPHEAIVESSLTLLLGAVIVGLTVRFVRHLDRLVVICAWCRRARVGNAWVTIEEFFLVHRAQTSHGMCPECTERFANELAGAA